MKPMERLTDVNWRNLDPWECCGQDKYCKRGCHEAGGCNNGCKVPINYRRLAAYEDAGLTPDEINRMLNSRTVKIAKGQVVVDEDAFNACISDNERLQELVKTQLQEIDSLKRQNSYWQDVCANLHITYGERIESLTTNKDKQEELLKQAREALEYCILSGCRPAQGVAVSVISSITEQIGGGEGA